MPAAKDRNKLGIRKSKTLVQYVTTVGMYHNVM